MSSFNETKYKNLLKELECKEISFSELLKSNKNHRLDSEYFSKKACAFETFIKSKRHFYINIKNVVSGPFGSTLKSSSYLQKGDIAFVRIENIKNGFHINTNNLVYISDKDNLRILNSQLFTDDIILSKVAHIGCFARVDDELKTCNISENNIGIKLTNYTTAQKHYILTYLNTKFGQILTKRRQSGNVQQKLNVDDICYVPIPIFNDNFYDKISDLILNSDNLIRQSKKIYANAEEILNNKLGLYNFKPSNCNISIKSLKDSFGSSGRIDAEYYQPKYDDYKNLIHSNRTVSDLCNLYDENFNPQNDSIYNYIELADVGTFGNITDIESIVGESLPSRARRLVKSGQVIISSVEGSLEKCALITDEYDKAICSTGFYVVDSNEINSETLLVLFKSKLIQTLMKQRCSGTILTAISKEEFLCLPLPIIDIKTQEKISEQIKKAFVLRRKAERLLEQAKTEVEFAINAECGIRNSELQQPTATQSGNSTTTAV